MRPKPTKLMDHREFPVLYVDDEPQNLRIFELTFRDDFTLLTAPDAEAGMQLLNDNPVAVVLSDHRMPGMTGVEFLSRVRELDPNTIRVLVTAYGDLETLGSAINDGSIYRYIPKPWEPEDMRLTLRRAIEMYALDREREALLSELTLLNELSRGMHRELELEPLLSLLLNATHKELGFDGAALLFFDADGDRLRWMGLRPDNDVAQAVRQLSITRDTAPHFVSRMRGGEAQALRVEGLDEYEGPVRAWVTEVSADEILVVPLVGKDEVIGALAIDNRSGGRRFGADDRTLLDGLAIQAVVAIENARLVEDLRTSREQVQRVDRLGTLGTLAAGLAHEINNPLVSIHTFLSLAPEKGDFSDVEFWRDYHGLAMSELERIRGLVGTMSRLAHGGGETVEAAPIDLQELATECVSLLKREMTASAVELAIECDPTTPKITAVRNHIHQIFLNLVLNAVHATRGGGTVRISIGPDPDRTDDWVCISVQDSGEGIPAEHLERIFDPFFTTKEPDQGTGLGLMISHQIVTAHGGSLEVRSREGEGSTFTVRLPANALQSGEARATDPSEAAPAGS